GYYATLSWLPALLKDHQMASAQAGWMLSFSAFPGMAAALATPLLAKRVPERLLVGGVVGFCGAAYLGLVLAPVSLAYLWMVLLGVGQGLGINLALGFIIARAPDSGLAAQLSTMAQAVGYLLAAAGPFLLGALHQLSGEWTLPLIALGVVLVPLGICGLGASRERFVAEDRADSARC
ncbi:MAG: MFS transporter, partial [Solirubrobacterales bacterium]|nr:MFS transporter [Solirubrobacterales bacterium]